MHPQAGLGNAGAELRAAGSPHGTAAIPSISAGERSPGKKAFGWTKPPRKPVRGPTGQQPPGPSDHRSGGRSPGVSRVRASGSTTATCSLGRGVGGKRLQAAALVFPSSRDSYLPCKTQTALKRQHRAVKRKML